MSGISAGVIATDATPSGVLATLSGEALVCSCLIRHCVKENGRHKDRAAESSDEWLD